MHAAIRWAVTASMTSCSALLIGCGSDLNSILYQSAVAAGQTVLDQFLTDVANDLADALERPDASDSENGDTPDGDSGGGDVDGDAEGDDGLADSLAAAEALFATCAACHCADAAGGCLPTAPRITSVDFDTLDNQLRGDAPHTGGKFELTDQEISDLEAFLASLGAPAADPVAGEALYGSCAACHCADASGGCLPDTPGLVGAGFDALDDLLRGDTPHTGGKSELTDQQIADLEAYLASPGS